MITLWCLQGTTLLAGAALSLLLTRKLAARPWAALVPQVAGVAAFSAELWYLILLAVVLCASVCKFMQHIAVLRPSLSGTFR